MRIDAEELWSLAAELLTDRNRACFVAAKLTLLGDMLEQDDLKREETERKAYQALLRQKGEAN